MKLLITGVAGFIGSHLAKTLLEQGHEVIGIDNLNDYYDVNLKHWRLQKIQHQNHQFIQMDITEKHLVDQLFEQHTFDTVIHLAAQAGVRYSLENPEVYISTNIVGFSHILEACRHHNLAHLIFASSSSVYGGNIQTPFAADQGVDHPLSLYAATKKSNEMMAHSYANLYKLPCTGLRFFTVYGPWGRPDMALFHFTHNIYHGLPIDVYNHGAMLRDFTYVDDIVAGILGAINHPATTNPAWQQHPTPDTSFAPYRLYNLGNNQPTSLDDFIGHIENALGKKAIKNMMAMQPGDVESTCANIDSAHQTLGFKPSMPIAQGIQNFVAWYLDYHQVAISET
jgi:UDP-glucuronate 4-epimerase